MKICVITPENPFKSYGGLALYSRQMIESLKLSYINHQIEIVCLIESNTESYSSYKDNDFLIHEVKIKASNKIFSLFTKRSYSSVRYIHYFDKIQINWDTYDHYIFNHRLSLGFYNKLIKTSKPNTKFIYINHNDEYGSMCGIAKYIKNPITRLLAYREAKKILREELNILKTFNKSSFINISDYHAYTKYDKKFKINNQSTIPIYLDEENGNHNYQPHLLLTGSFDWFPKKRNAEWLCNEVFPLIKEQSPETKLFIVGRKANCIKLNDQSNIEIHSDVDDINIFYNMASYFIIPERQSGGLKIKSIEAAMNRKVIVSTPEGISGSGLINNKSCLICEYGDKVKFSQTIINVLNDRGFSESISNNAYEHTSSNFNFNKVTEQWKTFWSNT
ncbi:hypothetical protein LNTAR_04351 [Lentisphaera araneosa HTCC2155]|uniref:Glycosyltransferase n=1 Tax=Lentisphaera araneosa HTCC2155 TaxID=313628 RepID=A6DQG9_9BACT|nr:glycosyltransferase [Lentisphaera araneosa]EDM26050.1 hypothetical protein LNTAR_04351 [Lentisphaera araneosa HTCC2155]